MYAPNSREGGFPGGIAFCVIYLYGVMWNCSVLLLLLLNMTNIMHIPLHHSSDYLYILSSVTEVHFLRTKTYN